MALFKPKIPQDTPVSEAEVLAQQAAAKAQVAKDNAELLRRQAENSKPAPVAQPAAPVQQTPEQEGAVSIIDLINYYENLLGAFKIIADKQDEAMRGLMDVNKKQEKRITALKALKEDAKT